MNYGNHLIQKDLRRGMTLKEVAKKINMYKPDVSMSRAYRIAQKIKRYGENTSINWDYSAAFYRKIFFR